MCCDTPEGVVVLPAPPNSPPGAGVVDAGVIDAPKFKAGGFVPPNKEGAAGVVVPAVFVVPGPVGVDVVPPKPKPPNGLGAWVEAVVFAAAPNILLPPPKREPVPPDAAPNTFGAGVVPAGC